MFRRAFLALLPPQLSEQWARMKEEEFQQAYKEFVEIMNGWMKKYAEGVFDKKLWDRGGKAWDRLRKFK